MRTVWRAALVAATILTLVVSLMDIVEIGVTGSLTGSRFHLIRMASSSMVVSILSTWYLGWKL